jgi:hypothetical protein
MGATTGPVLAIGGITAVNEVFFTHPPAFNWRIVPATLGLALALGGLEKLAPGFAVSLAWLALLGVLIVPVGKAPTPLENAAKLFGG